MQLDIVNTVKSTLVPDGHPFMAGMFAHPKYMNTHSSECVVLDARNIAAGPVARIMLPHQIGSGALSCWADASAIRPD